jgi:hypothetical protein
MVLQVWCLVFPPQRGSEKEIVVAQGLIVCSIVAVVK